jgi:plasmid stabilization system protein ParE
MKVRFNPEALDEYEDSALYYLKINARLAGRFVEEVEATVRRMRRHPLAYAAIEEDIRRCLVKKFPFGIYYTIEADYLLVVAVMHLSRMPGYWRGRI